jgi:hypothetical protein
MFSQNPLGTMGVPFTLNLDEIRMMPADSLSPPAPAGVEVRAFARHADVAWDSVSSTDVERVLVYRVTASGDSLVGLALPEDRCFADWLGTEGASATYRVSAMDWSFNESPRVGPWVVTTRPMSDLEMLTMTQEATFRYFWDHAHPVSGLARERYGSGETCAIGGTGFGIMAVLVGIERGFITYEQGLERVLAIARFLSNHGYRVHGAFPHWMNGSTGNYIPFGGPDDDSGDLVETAYLMEGLLAARQYFDGPGAQETELRSLATALWEGVDWAWFRPDPPGDVLYWSGSPTWGFAYSIYVQGWNEAMITYVLAVASPTHPVPASLYHSGWARYGAMVNGGTFYGYPLWVGQDYGGALFFAHYSFLGIDPRGRRDDYANYFLHNRNHALVHRAYAIDNPGGHTGYGANVWGLTASDDPWGYSAHAPYSNDNGTVTPTAALASMPYAPQECMAAMRAMYETYGEGLWGAFGFRDAFHPGQDWYADSYIAIDQGPIVVMIENHRTGLLWDCFMGNPEIPAALDAIGFVPDTVATGVEDGAPRAAGVRLEPARPNPFRGATTLAYDLSSAADVELAVFDLQGRCVAVLERGLRPAGRHSVGWDGRSARGEVVPPGVYLCRLRSGGEEKTGRLLRLQ